MSYAQRLHRPSPHALRAVSLAVLLALAACGGGSDDEFVPPGPPPGLGRVDTAPVPAVPAFVDEAHTNQRGDARYATIETNAGVRVLSGFLDLWEPRQRLVDAGVDAPARDGFPAITTSDWSGLPGDVTDGKVRHAAAHRENIDYVVRTTANVTPEKALLAYLDDRRGKNYSVTDGLGPLTAAWRTAARQFTTINDIAADAMSVRYDDKGNNTGVSGDANPEFGRAIAFVQSMGANASTEPAKRFYKYARPWRWDTNVRVLPSLLPARSSTPATDGGFPSGHTAESVRNAIGMAYLVPERFQELLARGLELGDSRIVAGMHSPGDVIGGRILGQASAVGNIYATTPEDRAAALAQARQTLMASVGVSTPDALRTFAQSGNPANDRFTDAERNRADYRQRMTFGFTPIADTTRPAVVPKGAEVVLETRQPYLSAEQRRVVLKTTALPSGYPILDDAEGYGRLNFFAAADGYGAFDGDVTVDMQADRGSFHARDSWRNDIGGAGKLTKQGSGTLVLTGDNAYTGGTEVAGGRLQAASATALGAGAVYVGAGTLAVSANAPVQVQTTYTQTSAGTLALRVGADGAGRLDTRETAALAGTLAVEFADGFTPKAGDVLTVLRAERVEGRFDHVNVAGFRATPVYTQNAVQLRLAAN